MILRRWLIKYILSLIIVCLTSVILTGCGTSKTKKADKQAQLKKTQAKIARNPHRYMGSYKIGQPYKINYVKYYPKSYAKYVSTGVASWYGAQDGFHGKLTANGDIFDKNMLTAAHKTLPLPSMVKVTNLHNNKSAILMINDRGPFCAKRLIDVSERAAEVLGFKISGTAKVKVVYLEHETKKLLTKLQLQNIHGKVAVQNILNPSCSVDCYLTRLNNGNLLKSDQQAIMEANTIAKNSATVLTSKKMAKQVVGTKLTLLTYQQTNENDSIFSVTPAVTANTSATATNTKLKHTTPIALSKINYYVTAGKFKTIAQAKDLSQKTNKYNTEKYSLVRVNRIQQNYQVKLGPINEFNIAKQTANQITNKIGIKAEIIQNKQKL